MQSCFTSTIVSYRELSWAIRSDPTASSLRHLISIVEAWICTQRPSVLSMFSRYFSRFVLVSFLTHLCLADYFKAVFWEPWCFSIMIGFFSETSRPRARGKNYERLVQGRTLVSTYLDFCEPPSVDSRYSFTYSVERNKTHCIITQISYGKAHLHLAMICYAWFSFFEHIRETVFQDHTIKSIINSYQRKDRHTKS